MKKILFTLCCALLFFNVMSSQTNWELLNPKPTANTGKDIEFITTNIGFIITSNELLETTDKDFGRRHPLFGLLVGGLLIALSVKDLLLILMQYNLQTILCFVV